MVNLLYLQNLKTLNNNKYQRNIVKCRCITYILTYNKYLNTNLKSKTEEMGKKISVVVEPIFYVLYPNTRHTKDIKWR